MPLPRKRLLALEATPNYHVVSRYVRKQYLCGWVSDTRRDFSHRRGWIRDRIFELAEIFAVEVCAYAVAQAKAPGWFARQRKRPLLLWVSMSM